MQGKLRRKKRIFPIGGMLQMMRYFFIIVLPGEPRVPDD